MTKKQVQELIEDYNTVYKTLEFISGIKGANSKRFRSTKYWLYLNHDTCATVLAINAKLCQDTLRIIKRRV